MRMYVGLRDSDTGGLRGEAGMGQMHRGKDGAPGRKGTEKTEAEMWKERQRFRARDRDRHRFRGTEEDRKDTEDRDRGPDAKEDRDGAGRGSSGFRWS